MRSPLTPSSVRLPAWLTALVLLAVASPHLLLSAADPAFTPLTVTRAAHPAPVDFDREILPILQANCLPCHNRTTSKADLLLESPAQMLKGGESGPALVPGKPADSLLFQVSAHRAKPRMPPKENKVKAANLTPTELGLLELWIEQGAKASAQRHVEIAWQTLPASLHPIYSAALSADGQWAVCGRGNQVLVFDTGDPQPLAVLSDPTLGSTPAAHRDLVQSVAISPDGQWIASGGYREIRVWQRVSSPAPTHPTDALADHTNRFPAQPLASRDGQRSLRWGTNGVLELLGADGKPLRVLEPRSTDPAQDWGRRRPLAQGDLDFAKSRLEAAGKEVEAQTTRRTKARLATFEAKTNAAAKATVEARVRQELSIAEAWLARLDRPGTPAEPLKAAKDRVEKAKPTVEPAASEASKAAIRLSTAGEEERLAERSLAKAVTLAAVAQQRLREAQVRLDSLPTQAPPTFTWPTWPGAPTAAAWSSNGAWVAVAFSNDVHVWSTNTGAWIATHQGGGMKGDRFSPDCRLSFGTGMQLRWQPRQSDFPPEAWSFQPRWELRHTLGTGDDRSPIADRVNALAFSPDGRRLASGSGEPTRGSEIRIWDPQAGTQLYAVTNLHSDAVLALAFSPDGLRLASGGADRFARVLDLGTAQPVAALEGHTGHVLAVSWRADGRVLASAGADNAVKFWNLATGDRAKTVSGFGKEVTALAHLGTTGDLVAASGETELRRVTEGGEKPTSYGGAKDFQHAAAATPDGRWLVAGGQDGVLRLWDITAAKLVREFRP